jgi:hypothetical protein
MRILVLAMLLTAGTRADAACEEENAAAIEQLHKADAISIDLARRQMPDDEKARMRDQLKAAREESDRLQEVARECTRVAAKAAREEFARRRAEEAAQAREAEARRLAEHQAAQQKIAEHRALVEQRLQDREWMRPVLSALRCEYIADRKGALADIAKEKKYSRIGGVVDLRSLHFLQESIRRDDDALAGVGERLAKLHVSALACSDASAKLTLSCRHAIAHECDEARGRDLAELAQASDAR